jgi:hypothetical protein
LLDAAGVRRLFACPDYRAAIAGWENWSALVIIIFVTSVPARLLYDPMLNDVYYSPRLSRGESAPVRRSGNGDGAVSIETPSYVETWDPSAPVAIRVSMKPNTGQTIQVTKI